MPQALTQEQQEKQRAKWRVQRAIQAGKEPQEADLLLLGAEEVDRLRIAAGRKAEAQTTQSQSIQVQALPASRSQDSQEKVQEPHQEARQGGDTTGKAGAGAAKRRPLSKNERAWADFYAAQFGPLVVLVLWVGMRDLEAASFYAPNPDEMRAISPYAARGTNWVVEKLKVPDVAVSAIQNSSDALDFCYIVLGYLHRIGVLDKFVPWVAEKVQAAREDLNSGGQAKEDIPRGYEGVPASANGHAGDGLDITTIRGLGAQYSAE